MGGMDGEVHAHLTALCRSAPGSTGTNSATLTLIVREHYQALVYSSDDVGSHLDEEQTTLGEGPSIDAYQLGNPVFAADLAGAAIRRWPVFAARASAGGVRAAFAFPMRIGAINLGVLSLYRRAPGPLEDEDISAALRLAGAAAYAALALFTVPGGAGDFAADGTAPGRSAPNGATGDQIGDQWPDADDVGLHRAEVHQASGMLMIQLSVPIEEALARMRAHSFAEGIPLREVARTVVARSLRLSDDKTGDGRK